MDIFAFYKERYEVLSTISFSFSAASFAGLLSLLQVSELDPFLIISLICFAIAIPIDLFIGTFTRSRVMPIRGSVEANIAILLFVTFFLMAGSILTLFLHFSVIAGMIFLICSAISALYFVYLNKKGE